MGVAAYAGLVVLLRASGKRTLTKMNAFDLIVTVALGSTLATVLLTKSVALADGLVAFTLLIALQFSITWLSVRSKTISRLVKSEPTLLVYQGQFLSAALRAERLTEDEVLAELRARGLAKFQQQLIPGLWATTALPMMLSVIPGLPVLPGPRTPAYFPSLR